MAAFGGYDGHLYTGGAKTGEGGFNAGEFRYQGVVLLFVVASVGLEKHLCFFGVYELHLAWEGLANVGEQGLARDVVAAEDLAGSVAQGLVDQLRCVDERPVKVKESRGEQSLARTVF